jgi:hypothetical protein
VDAELADERELSDDADDRLDTDVVDILLDDESDDNDDALEVDLPIVLDEDIEELELDTVDNVTDELDEENEDADDILDVENIEDSVLADSSTYLSIPAHDTRVVLPDGHIAHIFPLNNLSLFNSNLGFACVIFPSALALVRLPEPILNNTWLLPMLCRFTKHMSLSSATTFCGTDESVYV